MDAILIVDDDVKIARIIARYLEQAGFSTSLAGDGRSARHLLENQDFDAVVLDVLLPDTTGLQILQDLRRSGPSPAGFAGTASNVPVLILSALGMTDDIIGGLREGADDYLVKPFEPRELVERVKALRRRFGRSTMPEVSRLGNLSLNPKARMAMCCGQPLDLTRREFDLLAFLTEHPGYVFERSQLLDAVWGSDYEGSDRAVDLCVLRLRSKLEQAGAAGLRIDTVWGSGYRMTVVPG